MVEGVGAHVWVFNGMHATKVLGHPFFLERTPYFLKKTWHILHRPSWLLEAATTTITTTRDVDIL